MREKKEGKIRNFIIRKIAKIISLDCAGIDKLFIFNQLGRAKKKDF